MLFTDNLNNNAGMGCYITASPPLCDAEPEVYGECVRGAHAVRNVMIVAYLPCVLSFSGISVTMFMLCRKVVQQGRRNDQYRFRASAAVVVAPPPPARLGSVIDNRGRSSVSRSSVSRPGPGLERVERRSSIRKSVVLRRKQALVLVEIPLAVAISVVTANQDEETSDVKPTSSTPCEHDDCASVGEQQQQQQEINGTTPRHDEENCSLSIQNKEELELEQVIRSASVFAARSHLTQSLPPRAPPDRRKQMNHLSFAGLRESLRFHPVVDEHMTRGERRSRNRRRQTINQSLLYVAAFFVTYTFPFAWGIFQMIGQNMPFALNLLLQIFFPLGGFFNIIVYTRQKVSSVRLRNLDYSWIRAFWTVLKAGGDLP